jgi:glucosamine--fructose-6-phosphate aminotransferase (isomerizing)
MCGIVGVVGSEKSVSIIVEGLKKLEYRGYDSAGVAVIEKGKFQTVKEEGKISRLQAALKKKKLDSVIGIGHTRWATHGRPSKENAHPHASAKICVVHNGIIENHQELRKKLEKAGSKFVSQTDTEVVPHLIEYNFSKSGDVKKALLETAQEIHGSFALGVMFAGNDDLIAVAKRGSPLIIGVGENENYVASDYYAVASHTNKIITLDDDEFALISKNEIIVFNQKGREIKKEIQEMEFESKAASKEGYAHFMLKEIYEQPRVIEETIQSYVDLSSNSIHLPNFAFDLKKINKITIVACGTSYYSGMIAKYLFEEIANIEVEVDIASEFRYRSHPFRDDNLMIFISQSGETADTLAALKYAKANKQKVLSIVNAPHSTMAQLSDGIIRTIAGPEIGVASTKAYTAQIAVLSLLAIDLGFLRGEISPRKKSQLLKELAESGMKIAEILDKNSVKNIKKIADSLTSFKHILFIGRGISQITAFEAALKLRELSYINAQAIAAGELKHGTIALIDKKMPVVVIAPRLAKNELFEKTVSNAQEVNARGGKIIFVSDDKGIEEFGKMAEKKIAIPEVSGSIQEALLPIISAQLLSYYVALYKGNDVDQPRNLAKSVTVE